MITEHECYKKLKTKYESKRILIANVLFAVLCLILIAWGYHLNHEAANDLTTLLSDLVVHGQVVTDNTGSTLTTKVETFMTALREYQSAEITILIYWIAFGMTLLYLISKIKGESKDRLLLKLWERVDELEGSSKES